MLQNRPAAPRADDLMWRLASTLEALEQFIRDEAEGPEDLSVTQLVLLAGIVRAGDIHPTDLIKRGYYVGTNVTYNLHALQDKGYVSITRNALDKRTMHVMPTGKGKRAVEKCHDVAAYLEEQIGKLFSPETAKEMRDFLQHTVHLRPLRASEPPRVRKSA